ncbi:hypothetical protein [Nocardioides ferulae]|uniref:hypothetical protein n=1 Tax=Nocardioides ferulae TaxID=2340821 RepID=UPI000EB58750|nr:hypothetical protein [Nocardioides ferulae]
MSEPEVPGWNRYRDWHQQLDLATSAPTTEALAVLSASLAASRFTIKDATASGFVAKYVDWLAVLAQRLDWTTLRVQAEPRPGGALATVAVVAGGEHRSGQRRAAQGLSAAARELAHRGHAVQVGDWRSTPR